MTGYMELVRIIYIYVLIQEGIVKGVYSIELLNIQVKISHNGYKCLKYSYNEYPIQFRGDRSEK